MSERPWRLRHAFDEAIKRSVYDDDEYCLPADMSGWCVLDIGCHVGCFARLACQRGASVFGVEPDPESAALAAANLLPYAGRCRVIRAAAVAAPPASGAVTLGSWVNDPACRTTTALGRQRQTAVPAVSFEWCCLEAAAFAGGGRWRRVDLCKIDAEGVEYELVERCDFSAVDRLCVEFHDFEGSEKTRARAEACRALLAGKHAFAEIAWEEVHASDGYWYRLYRGERRG